MINLSILNNLEDLHDLRALYKKNFNHNFIGYYVLDNFVKWFENEPDIKHVTVYTLNDKWRQSGLYLIVDRYALFMNSLKPGDENLGEALKLLDWSRGYKITALPQAHHSVVSNALKELNIDWREINLQVYRLPWQMAQNFDIMYPCNFEPRKLELNLASILDNNFYSQQAGSLFFFQRLLKHNMNVGIFARHNEEHVAWGTRCQNGFLSSLFVKPAYRRQGLAELIIKIFAYKLAKLEKPEDTYAAVYIHNLASNSLFTKLGFKPITGVYHMVAYCVPKGCEWPFD